jgi:hypothetical protein
MGSRFNVDAAKIAEVHSSGSSMVSFNETVHTRELVVENTG